MVIKCGEPSSANDVQTIRLTGDVQNRTGSKMTTAVKICGISSLDIYEHCAKVGVDWVGFVFFPASPRHLSLTKARAMADAVDSDKWVAAPPRRVALCVDSTDDELAAIIDAARPDMLQLHGNETAERVRAIKSKFTLPVMPVKVRRKDIEKAALFSDCADWLLFDAAPHTETKTVTLACQVVQENRLMAVPSRAELPLPLCQVTDSRKYYRLLPLPTQCVDVSAVKNRGEKAKQLSLTVKAAKLR